MATPILVYGAGPGLGKTTIARHLLDTFADVGVRVRLTREEDVASLPALAPYVSAVHAGGGEDTRLLLACFRRLIDELSATDGVWILDSVLPGFDWLVSAGASADELTPFATAIEGLLRPLAPIVIQLRGDVRTSLERAMAARGRAWAADLAARRTDSGEVDDLVPYFERLQEITDELLARWTLAVHTIDTTRTPEPETLRIAVDAARGP